MAPPATASLPDGRELDLVALAAAVCGRYYEFYADEDARYGPAGRAWCQHDVQHLLNWAALDVAGLARLDDEVAWLARVLQARDFPLGRLAHSLDLGAAVLRDEVSGAQDVAAALQGAAAKIRERGTFV
jgi:hypothetical protein